MELPCFFASGGWHRLQNGDNFVDTYPSLDHTNLYVHTCFALAGCMSTPENGGFCHLLWRRCRRSFSTLPYTYLTTLNLNLDLTYLYALSTAYSLDSRAYIKICFFPSSHTYTRLWARLATLSEPHQPICWWCPRLGTKHKAGQHDIIMDASSLSLS